MTSRNDITQAELREFLEYRDGALYWRVRSARRIHIGDLAGRLAPNGYWAVGIRGRMYLLHRLIWLWHYGVWPTWEIDHIDRNPSNNKIENLRDVRPSVNQWNRSPKGYTFDKVKGRWMATICTHRKSRFLGYFDTAEEARTSYMLAKAERDADITALAGPANPAKAADYRHTGA